MFSHATEILKACEQMRVKEGQGELHMGKPVLTLLILNRHSLFAAPAKRGNAGTI